MKLHSEYGNTDGNKIAVAAALSGAQLEIPPFDVKFTRNKEFATRSAFKLLPALETEAGLICKGDAAMRLVTKLGGSALYPADAVQAAIVDEWLEYTHDLLSVPLRKWTSAIFTGKALTPETLKELQAEVKRFLSAAEARLKKSPYMLGTEMTLVDISLVSELVWGFRTVMDEKYRKTMANVTKLFNTVTALPEFQAVWGKPFLIKGALETPVKKEEPKPAPVAAAKPKEEEKKPEKKKNPIDELPESPFELDTWKKLYANTPDRFSTFPTFWETYDPNGWSIWFVKYQKYTGEGEVLYMFANSMDNFLHRMDVMRKMSFGTIGIYGEEPNMDIFGCFMWRGTEIFPDLEDHPQWEYYDRRKADINKPEDKALIEEYWGKVNIDDVVQGLRLREVRLWK